MQREKERERETLSSFGLSSLPNCLQLPQVSCWTSGLLLMLCPGLCCLPQVLGFCPSRAAPVTASTCVWAP